MTQSKTSLIRRARKVGALGVAAAALTAGAALGAAPAQAAVAPANTWDKLAACESGGNWSINTGNGYYGGLQFSPSTWRAYGGKGSANNASKAEQIRIAKKVQAGQGWGAWPACSAKLGLRGSAGVSDGATGSGANTSGVSTKSYSSSKSYASTKQSTPTKSYSSQRSTAKSYGSSSVKRSTVAAPTRSYSAPALALPKNVKDSGKDYVVKSGDTLAKIASKQGYGSWLGLYALNKGQVSNPDLIFVGQKLSLPAA